MKFSVNEKVRISRHNSLLFDASGKEAIIEDYMECGSLKTGKYYMYQIFIPSENKMVWVEENEILKEKKNA